MLYGITAQYPTETTPINDSDYVTEAVNFNGSCYLSRGGPLTGWGTPDKFTWSVWSKFTFNAGLFNDLTNFYCIAVPSPDRFSHLFGGGACDGFDTDPPIISAGWQNLTVSVDATNQIIRAYRGDTNILDEGSIFWDGTPATPVGSDFYFMYDNIGSQLAGDIADFRLWVGQYVDVSVLANRRLFVRSNGKPADPAAVIAALGTPIVEFVAEGTDPVGSFQINSGTGGAFTFNGTGGGITQATTSPTD